jgi:pimeloyl-ACP methyl ester carboxylesterase
MPDSLADPLPRTFVLIPCAGGAGTWYWHLVAPLLRQAGSEAVAVDLPGPDPDAGLAEYADLVAATAAGRDNVVLVAQSLGGFTAPMAATRCPAAGIVLVNAMIPVPGESAGVWWENTGQGAARIAAAERGGYGTEIDAETYFLHDLPADVLASGEERDEADAAFESACDFVEWPSVP